MRKYNSYHTNLKILAKRRKLPETYLSQIDRSTVWRWKQEPNDKYIGSDYGEIEVLSDFVSRGEALFIMRSYLKFAIFISSIAGKSDNLRKLLRNNIKSFVGSIERLPSGINTKLILTLCHVSPSVYYYWRNMVHKKCSSSPVELCKKTYPGQLTIKEVEIIKSLLSDERFKFWPVCSIAYYALREKLVSVSLATWYYYIKKLGISRAKIPRKKRYKTGIKTSGPNQIWHADITIVKTKDNRKHYVYLLMDNYSKYILNWHIEPCVSGRIRAETIINAYIKYATGNQNVNLIVDGGPENINSNMDSLANSDMINIKTLIALKDIPWSNSVIEAHNRLFKYNYLFRQEYSNISELRKVFAKVVDDYNLKRPHIALGGLTPEEVQFAKGDFKKMWSIQIEEARKNRISENKKDLCSICK